MTEATAPIRHSDRFFIGGQWVTPSCDAKISVIDSDTEQVYFTVPEAQASDISRAVAAAREAFDSGPWPWLTHHQRAEYLRAIGAELQRRTEDFGQIWPREAGVLHAVARYAGIGAQQTFDAFAGLADTYPFEEPGQAKRRFGPVLSVIPAENEDDAVRIANDTIYGLNASVFTNDVNRARQVGGRLRSGTVGHNAMRTDFGVSFGGYKQSGIGREGVREGLAPFLEVKFMVLDGQPEGFEDTTF